MLKLILAILQVTVTSAANEPSGRDVIEALLAKAEAACHAGNANVCLEIGEFELYYPAQTEAGFAKARQYLGLACDLGHMRGCLHLGQLVSSGRGGPTDVTAGQRLQERACDGGDIEACTLLGMHYQDEDNAEPDFLLARTYFARACDLALAPEDVMPCTFLTSEYTARPGLPPDAALARRAQAKMCEIDPENMCSAP